MKTGPIILLFLLYSADVLNAQDSLSKKRINPHFWYMLYNETHRISGKLYDVKDSFIIISNSGRLSDYQKTIFESKQININSIRTIWYWDRSNFHLSILLGALSGFVIGAIVGLQEEDDPSGIIAFTSGEKAIGDMVLGTAIGFGAGALIGSIKVRIPINGVGSNYSKYKSRLEKKSIRYNYLSGN